MTAAARFAAWPWTTSGHASETLKASRPVRVRGRLEVYRGRRQVRIDSVEPADEQAIAAANLLAVGWRDLDELDGYQLSCLGWLRKRRKPRWTAQAMPADVAACR